jgi:hypothetical protein
MYVARSVGVASRVDAPAHPAIWRLTFLTVRETADLLRVDEKTSDG